MRWKTDERGLGGSKSSANDARLAGTRGCCVVISQLMRTRTRQQSGVDTARGGVSCVVLLCVCACVRHHLCACALVVGAMARMSATFSRVMASICSCMSIICAAESMYRRRLDSRDASKSRSKFRRTRSGSSGGRGRGTHARTADAGAGTGAGAGTETGTAEGGEGRVTGVGATVHTVDGSALTCCVFSVFSGGPSSACLLSARSGAAASAVDLASECR